jgi:hypothetical protein
VNYQNSRAASNLLKWGAAVLRPYKILLGPR